MVFWDKMSTKVNLPLELSYHIPDADTSRELARMTDLNERSPPVLFMGIVTTPALSRMVTLKMEILGTVLKK